MGLVNGGAYAEKVAMPVDRIMKIPANMPFEQAAAIPEVFLTAYQTLYWIGKLQPQEKNPYMQEGVVLVQLRFN